MITFEKINNDAKVYLENERYVHYHTPDQLIKYYANYYDYKVMPTIDEFKEDLTTQQQFHEHHGQEHLLFIFPENEQLDEELVAFGKSQGCQLEHMELYRLKSPGQLRQNDNVQCEVVEKEGKVFDDFYVLDSARRQGVGSKLQEAVYEQRGGKEVILVADGNDTARDMYVKQGYEKVSEQWEMLKGNE